MGHYLASPQIAFAIMEGLHHTRVVPVLDDIVRPIVNLNLNSVASVVEQKDDALLPIPYHSRHILDGHLTIIDLISP